MTDELLFGRIQINIDVVRITASHEANSKRWGPVTEPNKPAMPGQPYSSPKMVTPPVPKVATAKPLTPPPPPAPQTLDLRAPSLQAPRLQVTGSLPPSSAPPAVAARVGPPQRPAMPLAQPPEVATMRGVSPSRAKLPGSNVLPVRRKRWFGRRRRADAAVVTSGEFHAEQLEKRRKLPAWMVSFIAHLIFILILAAVPLAKLAQGPLTVMLGFSSNVGIAEFELSASDSPISAEPLDANLDIVEPTTDVEQLLNVDLPELVAIEKTTTVGTEPALASIDVPFGIKNGLKGRTGELKSALLSKFGGNSDTEEAVDLGLKWLAKNQKSNGSWSLVGPYSDGGTSENVTAATALALNAFLGAGSTPTEGKYKDNVKLGLSFLLKKQSEDGYFPDAREPSRQQMYAQAIATITVTEAFGMTGDSKLRVAANKALKFAAWSQSELRGWRYVPREDADLSVTGWFVMALETGKMAGLNVDEEKLQQVNDFLDSIAFNEQSRYAYDSFEPPSLSMSAEGLLCRIYLGWPKTHPALLKAIQNDLLPSAPNANDTDYSVYYWYYATQVLHHVGGAPWEEWNRAMRRAIPALQEKAGTEIGSWSPSRDAFGASGGRLYTTCLNLYCLEVYYRHLAIYDTH